MIKKLYILSFSIIIASFPLFLMKSGLFIYEKPVNSKILLIEGWLPSFTLDKLPFDIKKYDTIFIVGIKQKTNWENIEKEINRINAEPASEELWLPTEGFLFIDDKNQKISEDTIKTIKIIAKGTLAKGQFAHFYISVKDSILGQTFVKADYDTFCFTVNVPALKGKLLNLYFDNDVLTQTEDINLVVKEIIINNTSYSATESELVYLKAYQEDHNFRLFDSNARETEQYLKNTKKVNSQIITIDTLFYKRNKTLASAKAFRSYLEKHSIHLNSLNIYSLDFHSKRTHIAYKKILDPKIQIGSIINSCPDCTSERGNNLLKQYWYSLEEFISLVVTWL